MYAVKKESQIVPEKASAAIYHKLVLGTNPVNLLVHTKMNAFGVFKQIINLADQILA